MVAEEVAPREANVLVREAASFAQGAKRGDGLDREEAALGPLVRLLQVHARGVDAPQDVLHPAADELALVGGKTVRGRCEVGEAPDPERGAEGPAHLRQLRLYRQVVGAAREQDRVHVRALQHRAEAVDDSLDPLRRVRDRRQPREVVVVREELACDHLLAACAPAEDGADVVDLVAHPPREQERVEAEAREQLRQLRGMPEAVRLVAGARRLDPEAAADAAPEQEIAHERLAADEDLVRQHVPRACLQPAGGEKRAQAALVVGTDVRIVLEHHRLAVERERAERLVRFERVEDAVDDGAEAEAEDLERDVPLPVPVGVRNDEEVEVGRLRHADTIARWPVTRWCSSISTAP